MLFAALNARTMEQLAHAPEMNWDMLPLEVAPRAQRVEQRAEFELRTDAGEQNDIAPLRPDVVRSPTEDRASLLAAARKPLVAPGKIDLDTETRARLKGLGYTN